MEMSFIIHKCGLHCVSAIQANESEPFMDNILGGSNSHYYHM